MRRPSVTELQRYRRPPNGGLGLTGEGGGDWERKLHVWNEGEVDNKICENGERAGASNSDLATRLVCKLHHSLPTKLLRRVIFDVPNSGSKTPRFQEVQRAGRFGRR